MAIGSAHSLDRFINEIGRCGFEFDAVELRESKRRLVRPAQGIRNVRWM